MANGARNCSNSDTLVCALQLSGNYQTKVRDEYFIVGREWEGVPAQNVGLYAENKSDRGHSVTTKAVWRIL